MELAQHQLAARREHLVEPLARRVHLEPEAGVRRDEGAPAAVGLDPQLALDGPDDHVGELFLVEREPEVVDPRQLPLARLDDDVHGSALELREPELEAHLVELLHGIPASNDWYSSPIRPCRATRPNASLPTYRASTWRTRLVTRW